MIVQLANIILRQANKTSAPRAYLEDLITAKFTDASAQGGNIVATTVNGKSVNLQTMPGYNARDIMMAAELALSCLESGLTRVPRQTFVVLR